MKDKQLYNIINKELQPKEKNVAYDSYSKKKMSITDEKGRKINIIAWKNQRGFIHFQTEDEQYRFTGKKELVFEGWI